MPDDKDTPDKKPADAAKEADEKETPIDPTRDLHVRKALGAVK